MPGRACVRWMPPGPFTEKGLSWNLGPPLFKHMLWAGPAVYGAWCALPAKSCWVTLWKRCPAPRIKGPQNAAQGRGPPAFSGWGATAAKCRAK